MPASTIAHTKTYLATIISRFRAKYGDNEWLVSCPDSKKGDRLKALLEGLRESNLRPKFVEIHTYKEDPDHVREVISSANELAAQIDAKVILGELRYHSEVQEKVIHDYLRNQPNNRIVDILQWPHAMDSSCPLDTAPPYDLGPYSAD